MANGTSPPATSPPLTPTPATPHYTPTALLHFCSGLSSGAFSAFLLQPADLLKTRLQQSPSTLPATVRQILASPRPLPTLWRGTVPSVLRTSVGSALYFSTLASIRGAIAATFPSTNLSRTHPHVSSGGGAHSSALLQLSPAANIAAGALTRAGVGFVMMPVTILKVRFESSMYPQYTSLFTASRSILNTEGFAGFFRGWGATAIRDAPNAGLYLFFYEWGKKTLSRIVVARRARSGTNHNAPLDTATSTQINMASGALAGAGATAVTNPFDTLKTRLQVRPGEYRNMWTAMGKVVREEGVRRLFDGLGLRMARKAVSSSLVWTGYEYLISKRRS